MGKGWDERLNDTRCHYQRHLDVLAQDKRPPRADVLSKAPQHTRLLSAPGGEGKSVDWPTSDSYRRPKPGPPPEDTLTPVPLKSPRASNRCTSASRPRYGDADAGH